MANDEVAAVIPGDGSEECSDDHDIYNEWDEAWECWQIMVIFFVSVRKYYKLFGFIR